METDRHASDGHDRSGESASPPPDQAPEATHEYGYGTEIDAEIGVGARPDGDTGPDTAEETGTPRSPTPAPATAIRSADTRSADFRSATGLRNATAPRAVLRPVPEGFPTPPPRPARPNRRPAPKAEPSDGTQRPRRLLIVGVVLAAVLALVVVIGGGILVVRSLTPAAPGAAGSDAPGTEAPADPAGPGHVQIGEVSFQEVSTEVAVRSVGGRGSTIEPEGEFVIITFEVDNSTTDGITITQNVSLEATDGTHELDREATRTHIADSSGYGLVPPGESAVFHTVFDVPIGTTPTGLHLELNTLGESDTLPLHP